MNIKIMKILSLILIFLSIETTSYSQNKTERFCEIHGNNKRIFLNYGNRNNFAMLQNSDSIINKLEQAKTLKNYYPDDSNYIDVLDYMSSIGWKLVHIQYNYEQNNYSYDCLFKKEFEK